MKYSRDCLTLIRKDMERFGYILEPSSGQQEEETSCMINLHCENEFEKWSWLERDSNSYIYKFTS